MFAGKKSAQIREILISESAWEEMTCLFAPSLEDSKNWPDKGLLFEEIAKRNAIPYDTMRDIIFALLAEEKPRLKQIFDKETASMYLQRVKK